jgi:hypothetical protein
MHLHHPLTTYPHTATLHRRLVSADRLSHHHQHDLSTEQVPVSAYVGSSKILKDLKDLFCGTSSRVRLCWELEELKEPKGPQALGSRDL